MRPDRSCLPVCILLFLCLVSPVVADELTGTLRFASDHLDFDRRADFDVIEMKGASSSDEVGCPLLPCWSVNVALPDGATVRSAIVTDVDYVGIDGTHDLMPVTRPRRISNPPQGNSFIKDQAVYGVDRFYPGSEIEIVSEWELVGQRFVTLRVFPVQYNPVSGKIRLARAMTWAVTFDNDPGGERKTFNFSEKVRDHYMTRLRKLAVNPDAVSLSTGRGGGSRALLPGDYEYVVITPWTLYHAFDDLVEYYTKTGIPAIVVPTEHIFSNYSGTSYADALRNFVIDAHSTWGAVYFLLGGDTIQVTTASSSFPGVGAVPNDTFYGDYNGDFVVDVYVGRAAVRNPSDADLFLSKTLGYMTNPPSGFGDEVFQMGFDLDNQTDGEDLMIDIYNSDVPSWAAYDREYDSESGGHESDVINYINNGHGVTNHCDHCNSSILGVGTHNHGTKLTHTDAVSFQNGSRAGIFYTLGCLPGAFDYFSCWGEGLVTNPTGGAVAFIGNTRYGWYNPGTMDTLSAKYDKKFFEALWSLGQYRVGTTLAVSKNNYIPNNNYLKYIFMELNVLGDPALPVWTDEPDSFSCSHDSSIVTGPQTFTVNVKQNGSNYSGATVCLWKDDEVYACATSDSSGDADFNIEPTDNGTMHVTVSDENSIPYLGSCSVTGGCTLDLSINCDLDRDHYQAGDTIYYDLEVTNNTGSTRSTSVWATITLPTGAIFPPSGGLYHGPWQVSLAPYETRSGSLSQYIPKIAPLGLFEFNSYVGDYPGIVDEMHEKILITIW